MSGTIASIQCRRFGSCITHKQPKTSLYSVQYNSHAISSFDFKREGSIGYEFKSSYTDFYTIMIAFNHLFNLVEAEMERIRKEESKNNPFMNKIKRN